MHAYHLRREKKKKKGKIEEEIKIIRSWEVLIRTKVRPDMPLKNKTK
jgi:hypothetical protein